MNMENGNVAYCGLYCGECSSFKKGKCPGCKENNKASWCKIRECCLTNGYASCAECTQVALNECKKFNNFFARAIEFVFRSDRKRSIYRIREVGNIAYAEEMRQLKRMSIKRGQK